MEQHHDEIELIEQISNGNAKTFEKLFNLYFERLHNIAYNRVRSAAVADDLVQDIFVDLWTNRKTTEIHTSVKSYLFQAVRNKVCNHIRHLSVREKELYIRRIYEEYYTRNPFPQSQEVIEGDELKHMVSKYLNDLPEKSRTIFSMSREEQYTYTEIAKQLNCSPKTVEYHIGKVLQHLRINLKNYVAFLIPLCLL